MTPDNPSRPVAVVRHQGRDTSTLTFRSGKTAEFFVRGAICWPIDVGGRVEGYGIMAGWHVGDGRAYVFEESELVTIAPVRELGSGRVTDSGSSSFFNIGWQAYMGATYFCRQSEDVLAKYRREVRACGMIQPKPRFVSVEWATENEGANTLYAWLAAGRVAYAANGGLDRSYKQLRGSPGRTFLGLPPLHALVCLLTGLDQHPWRRQDVSYEMPSAPRLDRSFW